MPTISLCLITKNESENIPELFYSVSELIDEVILVDTGSYDNTVSLAKSLFPKDFVKAYTVEWGDDFSKPRQLSFDKATSDWILFLDADDTLVGADNLKKFIEENGDTFDVCSLIYDYAFNDAGKVCVQHWRERLFRNYKLPDGTCEFKWHDPVHEHVIGSRHVRNVAYSGASVTHRLIPTDDSAKRNLRILENWINSSGGVEKASSRQLHFLGSEYLALGNLEKAIESYERYFSVSTNLEESGQLRCKLASIYTEQRNYKEALKHLLQAILLIPYWPDPWLVFGQIMLYKERYKNAITYSNIALSCKYPKETSLVTNPLVESFIPYAIRYKANLLQGNLKECLPDLEKCLRSNPRSDIEKDYKFVKASIEQEELVDTCLKASDMGMSGLTKLPEYLLSNKKLQKKLINELISRQDSSKPKISIYTGDFIHFWGPNTAEEVGLGGSETAVSRVAEKLSKQGYSVRIYGNPGPYIGYENDDASNPLYLPFSEFDPDEKIDIFISCRRADIVDKPINALERWLWLHDTNIGETLTPERAQKFNRFLMVSQWQANQYLRLYEGVTPEKITIIGNGINLSLLNSIDDLPPKDLYKFISTSSPDRGLIYLLELWPKIWEKYPRATLDIYYGWDDWDKYDVKGGSLLQLRDKLKELCELYKNAGVTVYNKIGQKELYYKLLGAGVIVWPSLFCETYCISLMEAMACGVIYIGSNIGALSETSNGFATLVEGSPDYIEVKEKFLRKIDCYFNSIYKTPQEDKLFRLNAAKYAMSQTWDKVVEKLTVEISRTLQC